LGTHAHPDAHQPDAPAAIVPIRRTL